ncbi:MAG TPA: proline--tRNA ligase [Phycisphaerae bacterium]|nr:proline--tRNA ligase [Phycisphaerae bacterium]HRW53037.1 proline--tRNA ligase [Phycisphaerae bacterium]
MRWSQFFIVTSKETPKDATAASHRLMLRTGMVRQLAAGIYSYLPLGFRSLRKVERIVREEMNRAGAIELMMPVLHPIDLWEETGRVAAMGDVLLRLGGPEGDWRSQTVLGPTHEEIITEISRAYLKSYKQLPINLYQIQVKFRGEARPKSGVLRTREFLMKDAYSFHDSVESLDEGYQKMYDAYCRIFARCGLPYAPVEAESGPIGGDASHEFMVLTDAGEDLVALTENKDYAANTERAVCAPLPQDNAEMAAIEEVHTPNQRTIDEVSAFLKTTPSKMIKTLVYLGTPPTTGKKNAPAEPAVFVALVRGDHDANENKLNRAAGKVWTAANGGDGASISLELADEGTIRRLTGADVGFAGPHTLDASGVPYYLIVDQGVAVMRNGATGANKTDYHAANVNPGRDFAIEGPRVVVADIRNVVDGDLSPRGGGSPIRLRKAIEVGHVFKLGTKYSDSMGATYLDRNGKAKPLIMGCYGIGLNRIMASAIEANHDDGGVIWPMSIAPFQALVVALDPREEEVMQTAGRIHDALEAAGVDTLLDDRDERAGFKFKDADLIGFPVRVTVGRKALADGVVEVKLRSSDEIEKLAPDAAIDRVKSLVADAMNALSNG